MPEIYTDQLGQVFRDLILATIVYFAYRTARNYAERNGRWNALWKGAGLCLGVAALAAVLMGKPSCVERDDDPLRGDCLEYADDGFTPATDARHARLLYFALLLTIPVGAGVLDARKSALHPWRRPEAKVVEKRES